MTRLDSSIAKQEYELKSIRQLGINILTRAALDALLQDVSMVQKKHQDLFRRDAINFLTGKFPEDLKEVCELAGVEPETIVRESKKLLANGSNIKNFNALINIRENQK